MLISANSLLLPPVQSYFKELSSEPVNIPTYNNGGGRLSAAPKACIGPDVFAWVAPEPFTRQVGVGYSYVVV